MGADQPAGDVVEWPIEIRPNGTVIYDGIAIGGLDFADAMIRDGVAGAEPARVSSPRLTLNLGWLRLAGVGIRIEDDPTVDHHRDGVVLER